MPTIYYHHNVMVMVASSQDNSLSTCEAFQHVRSIVPALSAGMRQQEQHDFQCFNWPNKASLSTFQRPQPLCRLMNRLRAFQLAPPVPPNLNAQTTLWVSRKFVVRDVTMGSWFFYGSRMALRALQHFYGSFSSFHINQLK